MFTVGIFARLSGVSAKALRAYDELGLFRPAWVDPDSGYRYYSPAQLPGLRRIVALRDMGMGLGQIGRLVGGRVDLESALRTRRADLEREHAEAARRLAALDISVAAASSGDPVLDVVVRRLPEETVATLDLADVPGLDDTAAFDRLEAVIRDLGRRAHRPPGALLGDGTTVGRSSDVIFVPIRGPIRSTAEIAWRVLPSVRAATLLVKGPYRRLGQAKRRLDRWIAASGQRISGPTRLRYLQFGADPRLAIPRGYLVDAAADYLTELQVPIEPG
ncbi:MAG: MerR family transcriptional regulator [Candidatus Limnocylindrales bacterium]